MFENHLEFEAPLAELQNKIVELQTFSASSGIDVSNEISALEQKLKTTMHEISTASGLPGCSRPGIQIRRREKSAGNSLSGSGTPG